MQKNILEIKNNIRYFYFIVMIIIFIFIENLFIDTSLMNIKNTIAVSILLFFTALIHRTVFSFFIICILFLNIIRIHLVLHWGNEYAIYDLSSRIGISLESPLYESIEYLQSYIDYRDYITIFYSLAIILLLFIIPKYKQYDFNLIRIIGIILSIFLIFLLHKQFPFVIIRDYKQANLVEKIIIKRNKFISSNIPTYRTNGIYDKVIFILGESVNSKYLNVYGYDKNTTPFLSNLFKSKKLYKFNAIAGTNQTSYAVPMLFTKANVVNWKNNFIHSLSIISYFKYSGYATYWISNQGKVGKHEGFPVSIANESNRTVFLNKGDYGEAKTDMELISYLHNNKIKKNKKEMFVLHLIGSHFKYSERITKKNMLNIHPENIIEEYENTIYFTDNIIKKIFKYFNNVNKKVLIIYVSDHGEVVSKDKYGHGFAPAYKDEYKVPLLVYSNIENIKLDNIQKKVQSRYINTENLNDFILYISGLSKYPNLSYSKKVFTLNPKNIKNYDLLINEKAEK